MSDRAIRLGFACIWDQNPRRTWSYTPWDLREALRRRPDVELVDVGFTVPTPLRRLLQVASLRRRAGRWVAPWEHLRAWEAGIEYSLNKRAEALRCDAVLQIQDLGAISTPFLTYQDFSYDVIIDCLNEESLGLREYFPHLDARSISRRRKRQLRVYDHASRVLTMSDFLRQSLIERTGLSPDKVVTVRPGVVGSVAESGDRHSPKVPTQMRRRRLLFVGTTFLVKGGDLVLAAFALLRKKYPDMTLSIVGPASWPIDGAIPEGVSFRGRLSPVELPQIYREQDLLVVPSRLEGFGKVFVEALSNGLPCIGRKAFAMPELIQPGVTGDLLERDSPEELATLIEGVLGNDHIYQTCEDRRRATAAHFSWDRAAHEVIDAARAAVHSI